MNETQKSNSEGEEIDLKQLFNAIGSFFSNVLNGIENAIIKFKRRTIEYKWLLISFLLLGVLAGVVLKKTSLPIYSSSMLLSSDYFNGRIVDNTIDKLNLLCQEEDRKGLANVLAINMETALNIVGFETEPFVSEADRVEMEVLKEQLSNLKVDDNDIRNIIARIEIENKNTYQIKVYVLDNKIIGNLETAIVDYFRNNNYIKTRIEAQKNEWISRKKEYEEEAKKLDSLKDVMISAYKSISDKSGQGSDNLYIGEQYTANPIEVFQEHQRVVNQILYLEKLLFLNANFEVIDGLTTLRVPQNAGLIRIMFYSILISLGLAYFIILILVINKYLSKKELERFGKL